MKLHFRDQSMPEYFATVFGFPLNVREHPDTGEPVYQLNQWYAGMFGTTTDDQTVRNKVKYVKQGLNRGDSVTLSTGVPGAPPTFVTLEGLLEAMQTSEVPLGEMPRWDHVMGWLREAGLLREELETGSATGINNPMWQVVDQDMKPRKGKRGSSLFAGMTDKERTRQQGKVVRVALTDVVLEVITTSPDNFSKWTYKNITDQVYMGLFGGNAVSLRNFFGRDGDVRDMLEKTELAAIGVIEFSLSHALEEEKPVDDTEALALARQVASEYRVQYVRMCGRAKIEPISLGKFAE